MTVETPYVIHDYSPGSAMAAEAVPWTFLSPAHLRVTHIADADGAETVLTLGDDFTVGGSGPAGTGTVAATAEWPDDDVFRVERVTPAEQKAVIASGQPLPAKDVNDQLDRMAMIAQERDIALGRALLVPVGSTPLVVGEIAEGEALGRVGDMIVGVPNAAAAFEQAALETIAQIAAQIAVASGHATTATTQAGISTAQAVVALAQATIALAQAGIATTQAGIATAAAAAPALKVQTNPATATTPPAGVSSGDLYWAVNADASLLTLYLNTAGTGAAVLVSGTAITVPTGVAVTAAIVAGEDFQRYQRGYNQSYVALHVGQTADQLKLRSTSRFSLRHNALISPAFICERSERMRKAIVCWAHSGGAGAGSTFSPNADVYENVISGQTAGFMGRLKARLGEDWRVYNQGIGAQGAEAIAARMGAIPTRVIVTGGGGTIPASGAVNCTLTTAWLENAGGVGYQIPATINGVPVIIKAPVNGGATPQHTVEQVPGASAPLAVASGTLIVPSTGDLDYAINIFYIDRNGQDLEKMRYLTGQMAAKVKGERRFIFISTWNWRNSGGEVVGTDGYNKTIAINDEYRRMWPRDQFDARGLLRGDWPFNGTAHRSAYQLLNLSASPQDLIDLPLGYIPNTFSASDGSHQNDAGQDAMAAHLVEDFLPSRGWRYD